MSVESFTASGGTVFRYDPAGEGNVCVQISTRRGVVDQHGGKPTLLVDISAKDLGEFIQHVALSAAGDVFEALFASAGPKR